MPAVSLLYFSGALAGETRWSKGRQIVARSVKFNRLVVIAGLSLVMAATGCSCGPDPDEASIVITSPMDGAALSLADDVDDELEGVQISVEAMATGLAVSQEVTLRLDGASVATANVTDAGLITWSGVTLSTGAHTLVALTEEGGVVSAEVSVTVNGDCFAVNILTPEPGGDSTTLGREDDTDGMACGMSFETTVLASTGAADGAEARVFVNGTPRRTARVEGGAVRFDGVVFGNRGETPNTLRVEVTDESGVTCDTTFGGDIFVDCDGPSCEITDPATDSGFLNQSDDDSDADGFQSDFEVTTSADGANQPIRLVLDGDTAGALSEMPSAMVATFGNVELSEGVHRVQAECSDDAGNVTTSTAEWTVDITPCGVTLDEPTEGQLFTEMDDLDGSTTEIDIDALGTAGADCVDLRVGPCTGIDAQPFGAASASWMQRVTLGASATQDICVQTRDEAGNVSQGMSGIRVRTMAPQVEILTPSVGAGYNLAGTAGRTADLMPSTPACEALVEVYCTDVGVDVTLLRETPSTVLGTAACVADAGAPPPYAGLATFAMAPLPTRGDGMSYNLIARQEVSGLIGTSSGVSITADCVAPSLSIGRPMCGAILRPTTQDEDMATPGFQYQTNVVYTNGIVGDTVTLTIAPAGGGAPIDMPSRMFTGGTLVTFVNANYGAGGMLSVTASTVDNAGNSGTSSACTVTVEDLPSVSITAPMDGSVLTSSDDCDGGMAGFQGLIQGTTDAAAGSTVDVTGGGSPPVMTTVGAGGAISLCTSLPEGPSAITVRVTDARGSGSATVNVTVDTLPPTNAIDDLAATVTDRRGGVARFSWTAVADVGGGRLQSYDLRCADAAITDEAGWMAADTFVVSVAPGSPGAMQSEDIGGFRPGETVFCVLRAADAGGALTPIPAMGASVTLAFLEQEVQSGSVGSARMGELVAPIGDVNGDGVDDVLVGGRGEAYLYFGSSTGLGATANVTFTSTASGNRFGRTIAGIGDFNGDGRGDIAIGDNGFAVGGENFQGAVYVLFGRPSTTPWPSTIDVFASSTAPFTCTGADVCFVSDDGVAGTGADAFSAFGWSISTAGDFDGDGLMDLAVGATGLGGGNPGHVYILLGSMSYTSGTAAAVPGTTGPDGFVISGDGVTQVGFGNAVSTLGGDLGGDMLHDLIISASGNAGMGIGARVSFLTGRAYTGSGLVRIPLSGAQTVGTGTASAYGLAISGGGDINGDGFLDALVHNTASGGRITAYLGAASGFTGATTITYTSDSPSSADDFFGRWMGLGRHPWLMTLGDVDGDRVADIYAGSQQNGTMPGTSHLFYRDGSTTAGVRSDSVTFSGASGSGLLQGFHAAYIGDVNGDGAADLAVGDPAFMSNQGRMLIHY